MYVAEHGWSSQSLAASQPRHLEAMFSSMSRRVMLRKLKSRLNENIYEARQKMRQKQGKMNP